MRERGGFIRPEWWDRRAKEGSIHALEAEASTVRGRKRILTTKEVIHDFSADQRGSMSPRLLATVLPITVALAFFLAACASSAPTPIPTETPSPVRPTVTPIPVGGGDRLICDPQGMIVREDGKTPATPFPTEAQIREFNSCVITEAQKAVTQRVIEQIGVPQKDKKGNEVYPEGSLIRNFQLIALNGIPSALPEGQREAMKQELINDDIPRLQKAREALRSGNTEEARRIIANEREILEFMSRTYLNLYPSLSLDANGNKIADYFERVYGQVLNLEDTLRTLR